MQHDTIVKLQNLTSNFYRTVATQFSDTRQAAWPGWEKALTYYRSFESKERVSVLDVGCGNGRFLNFLMQKLTNKFSYDGIDNNESLLQETKELLFKSEVPGDALNIDILKRLLASPQNNFPELKHQYDLIACFGVFHHIPSKKLRTQLIQQLAALLETEGVLIISCWQFAELERFQKKLLSPELFNIDSEEFEENDYLLGWDTQSNVARYCHSFSEDETKELSAASGLKCIAQFKADGKDNTMNNYLVLQRSTQ